MTLPTTTRRPGVDAIHSIDHYGLTVPDLEPARRFFSAFGLHVRDTDDGLAVRAHSGDHVWVRVRADGHPKRLAYLSFGAYPEDVPAIERQARMAGAEFITAPPGAPTGGFWLRDPDGLPVQVRAADKVTATQAPAMTSPQSRTNPIGTVIAPSRSQAAVVHPQRLSHLLLFCTDVPRALDFYTRALGLRLSDRSQDLIAFSHGAHASDHHLLAWVKSETPGLHHSSWIVRNVDEIGRGMEQMFAAGFQRGWGVGRHVIGSNYFYYAQDPWGSFAEFSCGIDFIDERTEWPAADHPAEDSFYLWGPAVPEDFTVNREPAR